MRKLLALMLTASMPLAGVAQSPAPAHLQSPQPAPQLLEQMLGSSSLLGGSDARAVPLWSTPDGRILTLVSAGSNHNPTLPKSPQIGGASEWRLIDVTNLVSGGLLMRIGNNANAQVSLSRSALQAPLAAWKHPLEGLQPSVVQILESLQESVACWHPPAPAHESVVQALASLHRAAPPSSVMPLQLSSIPLHVSEDGAPGVQVCGAPPTQFWTVT